MRQWDAPSRKRFRGKPSLSRLGLILFLIFCAVQVFNRPQIVSEYFHNWTSERAGTVAQFGPVLVLYVYSGNDPTYVENLRYFVREGVKENDGATYIFAVQLFENGKKPRGLPKLPKNARYVYHKNECYDWGTFGWIFLQKYVRLTKYNYFVFMNGSVRGPFFPAYQEEEVHWSDPFLSRINDKVKLVGPTINCGGAYQAEKGSVFRENPHVQSYFFATDMIGLRVLLNDGQVFACHPTLQETVFYSEVGASAAILRAGFTMDSLMLRYQGVDWRDTRNWACNWKINPCFNLYYDGVYINPLEVHFVKVKDSHREGGSEDTALLARKYSEWRAEAEENVRCIASTRNEPREYRGPIAPCQKVVHQHGCLDIEYYRKKNRDLPEDWSDAHFYLHFAGPGHKENRHSRFACKKRDLYEEQMRLFWPELMDVQSVGYMGL